MMFLSVLLLLACAMAGAYRAGQESDPRILLVACLLAVIAGFLSYVDGRRDAGDR